MPAGFCDLPNVFLWVWIVELMHCSWMHQKHNFASGFSCCHLDLTSEFLGNSLFLIRTSPLSTIDEIQIYFVCDLIDIFTIYRFKARHYIWYDIFAKRIERNRACISYWHTHIISVAIRQTYQETNKKKSTIWFNKHTSHNTANRVEIYVSSVGLALRSYVCAASPQSRTSALTLYATTNSVAPSGYIYIYTYTISICRALSETSLCTSPDLRHTSRTKVRILFDGLHVAAFSMRSGGEEDEVWKLLRKQHTNTLNVKCIRVINCPLFQNASS